MLEHADRDDAVEFFRHVAIVLQLEFDLVRQSLFRGTNARARKLLLRQRDAGDARAAQLGEIERKSAPAASDIEHALAGRDEKLGCEMSLLGELGVVERLVRRLEIGAAVLPVGIEKQRIELSVEIVVVRDVATRTPTRIELLQTAMEVAQQPLCPRPKRRLAADALVQHNSKNVGDRALLDHHGAVHIGFAEFDLGIDQHTAFRGSRDEADRDRCARAVAYAKAGSARGCYPQVPHADKSFQCRPKQPIHRPPPTASTASTPPRPRHIWSPPASARITQTPQGRGKAISRAGIKTKFQRHGNARY